MAILLGTIVGGLAAKDGGHPALVRRADHGVRAAVLGREPAHPAHRRRARPTSRVDPNIARSTGALLQAPVERSRGCGGAALVTSWFWLVGAVVLSLMPPLVKNVLGGTEEVVTAFLAIFSIVDRDRLGPRRLARAWPHRAAADADRRLAARPVRARPRPGDLLGGAGGRAARASPASSPRSRGLRIAIDLAGLAIAGGLFIVPSFAAVQAWAGADRRARVIAAVNVLNAGFMVGRHAGRRRAADGRRHAAAAVPASSASPTSSSPSRSAAPCRRAPCATSCRSCSAPSTGSR